MSKSSLIPIFSAESNKLLHIEILIFKSGSLVFDRVKGFFSPLGDGTTTKFWHHNWIPDCGVFWDLAANSSLEAELEKSIFEYVGVHRCWLINSFKDYIPNHITIKIVSMLPPMVEVKRI